eukprot:TRINITY_DN7036_c0_g1_i1.p2 TRINITY_DN7036_c0_g1~~TRINITY_DN7036_c0_g1_i1.p2  ORF type:complete len:158 (-),score=20.64 TRINITY_DN7036_c0_g1_i1:246-719(-)
MDVPGRATDAFPFPQSGTSPAKVLLVRHGESTWNKARASSSEEERFTPAMFAHLDSILTPLGETQAQTAGCTLAAIDHINIVLVSPLIRCLQTAEIALKTRAAICKETTLPKVVVVPALAEVLADSCDIGSSPAGVIVASLFSPATNVPKLDFQPFG